MVLAGPRKGKGLGWGVEWEASTEGRGFAGHRRALVYSLALCEEFRHRRDLVELGAVGGRPARVGEAGTGGRRLLGEEGWWPGPKGRPCAEGAAGRCSVPLVNF